MQLTLRMREFSSGYLLCLLCYRLLVHTSFNQFTDVSRLARSLIMNNYNSFQYGEPTLTNGVTRTLSLLYQSFNLFNNTDVAKLSQELQIFYNTII